MPEHSEDFEDVIVQALSEPEFADGLRALHHRHLRLDANARHFIAKQVVEALGLEQVGWFVRFPSGIESIRLTPFTNGSDMGRQQPVYARPPAHTEDSRQAQWWCWVHGGWSVSLAKGCERQHVDTRFASTPCSWVRSLASKEDDHG